MPAYYNTAFFPLDIGKNVNWFASYAGYELKPIIEPRDVLSNRQGFEQATTAIDTLLACGAYDRVVIGLEPTGVYHENWSRKLVERYQPYLTGDKQPRLDFCFLNPWVSSRRRDELNRGRKRKSDPIDLKAMTSCLRDGLGQEAFLADLPHLRFQLWGKTYLQNRKEHNRLAVSILAQVDRLWPGAVVNLKRFRQAHPHLEPPVPLVSTKALERLHLRAILQHCPNPYHFLALGTDGIQAFFRTHVGRCGPATANLAFKVAQNAILPPSEVAELLADQLQTDFQRLLALESHLERLASQAELLVPDSPAAVLTTIPGIADFLAARYLAHLGHYRRFTRPAQIWAFAGFDLVTEESGDFRRLGKITKKGEPAFRDTLYLIGLHTAQQIPAIGRAKQRALARGLGKVGATIHAAGKANRLCHHLLYHQLPFDPDRVR
jgi:transposase